MAMMDKFLNMMRLNSEEEDDFYDDDYYDEEDDYYEEPKRKSFRREKEKEEDTTARFATTKESKSAVKSNSKVTPMRQVKKNQGGNTAMEVCVIKPTSVEDAREITETLLRNRTVVLKLLIWRLDRESLILPLVPVSRSMEIYRRFPITYLL